MKKQSLVLDIETSPLTGDALEGWSSKWEDKWALHPETCRVLIVGIYDGETVTQLEGDEADILTKAWKFVDQTPYPDVVGHNLLDFDIRVMACRSYANGVKVPRGVFEGKWIAKRFMDTMQTWAGPGGKISLDNLGRVLGLGRKQGDSAIFYETYAKDRAAALADNANHLRLTWACAQRMGLI